MGEPAAVKVTRIDSKESVLRFLVLTLIIVFSCVYFTFPTILLKGNGGGVFAVMTPIVIFGLGMAFCTVFRLYQGVVAFGLGVSLLLLLDILISFTVLFQGSTRLIAASMHWGYYVIGLSALLTIPVGLQLHYGSRTASKPATGERLGYWIGLSLAGMAVFVGLAFLLPGLVILINGKVLLVFWLLFIVVMSVVVGIGGLLFSRFKRLFNDKRVLPAALVLACWSALGLMNTAVFHYFNLMLTGEMIIGIPILYLAFCSLSFSLGASVIAGFLIFRAS